MRTQTFNNFMFFEITKYYRLYKLSYKHEGYEDSDHFNRSFLGDTGGCTGPD